MPKTILLQVNREQQEWDVVACLGIPENLSFFFLQYQHTCTYESVSRFSPSSSESNWRSFCCFISKLFWMREWGKNSI